MFEIVFKPRTPALADLIDAHLAKQISFAELCSKVAAMGYKTTSLYEMVCAAEYAAKQKEAEGDPDVR